MAATHFLLDLIYCGKMCLNHRGSEEEFCLSVSLKGLSKFLYIMYFVCH